MAPFSSHETSHHNEKPGKSERSLLDLPLCTLLVSPLSLQNGYAVSLQNAHEAGRKTEPSRFQFWDLLPWERERGEEWTVSAQWKEALVNDVLNNYIRPATTVLEIGPGGGRWTEILLQRARNVVAVDVSAKAIEVCRKRFPTAVNVDFFLAGSPDLPFIPDNTIDAIWSFDVFVHINPDDTDRYLSEFKRVLVTDGTAVIHHPQEGGMYGGCRSRMTGRLFSSLLEKHGLTLVRRFDSWGDGRFDLSRYRDCISVFTS